MIPTTNTGEKSQNFFFNNVTGKWEATQPATEETAQSIAGFNIPKYDEIAVTYPTTSQEVYTYKLLGATVGTITVNYSDAVTKAVLSSVVKS